MRKMMIFTSAMALLSCGSQGESVAQPEPVVVQQPDSVTQPIVTPPEQPAQYIGFESAPVRPIAITEDGKSLLLTNVSNNSVEVFSLDEYGNATFEQSVAVGLEPVAVAIYKGKAWVVNHLSDSVSIIDLNYQDLTVERTLLVGDEPRDVLFANDRAFVTTAHRGQQRMNEELKDVPGLGDPALHTAGVGRADIWVFNANDQGSVLGGKPIKVLNLFGDTLRGLAKSADESLIYAAVMNSGNQTTLVHEAVMCEGFEDDQWGATPCKVLDEITSPNGLDNGYLPGGRTAPGINKDGEYQPWTSMIVKYDQQSGEWRDTKGRNFSNGVRFNLPDLDVFEIDTENLVETQAFAHVGTTQFNVAVNLVSGSVYVSNTEANNATRFEGSGDFAGSTVQGNIARTQVSVINPAVGSVKPRHLNAHIDYSKVKSPEGTKESTLAIPNQMMVSANGKYLYMAAMGSDKVAVIPTTQLEYDVYWDKQGIEFNPQQLSEQHLNVPCGPAGILLAEQYQSLYVFTRFDNSLVRMDIRSGRELQRIQMPTLEPENITAGRFMLYDAKRSSSNGEVACASCHVYGDTDHLSWNLGNPDSSNLKNPQPFPTEHLSKLGCLLVGPDEDSCQLLQVINGNGDERGIAAMKGPMGTQTLRGMQNHGHMHWRGDRSVGYFGTDLLQTLDERTSFKNFIVAFEGLHGMDIHLPETVESKDKSADVIALEQDMDKFADFALSLALPPNPIRALDNDLSGSAQKGADFFHGDRRSDGAAEDTPLNGDNADGVNCEGCHGVDHSKGFYGSRGEIAHGGEIQILKVPQLRNLYTRVGMFGLPDRKGFLPSHTKQHQGDQIRGFGFLHDGATDQLINFLRGGVFDNGETGCPEGADERHGCHFNAGTIGIPDESTRQGLVDYMMEFDNDLAPVVGQQITLTEFAENNVATRIRLFEDRAKAPFVSKLLGGQVTECDLVATGIIDGQKQSFLFDIVNNNYRTDKTNQPRLTSAQLQQQARQPENALTFTCHIPGTGWRQALDSDMDGTLNRDETGA